MKKLIILTLAWVALAVSAQGLPIRPNTIYCNKGSEAHPTSYCADSTPCKSVDGGTYCLAGTANPPAGATVGTATCWSMATDFTCMEYKDGCTSYSSNADCKEIGTAACTRDAQGQPMLSTHPKAGQCQSYTRTFSCKDPRKEGSDYTVTTECETSSLQNGLEWTVKTESMTNDFMSAVTGQEIARQIAVYGQKDNNGVGALFPGESLSCRDGYFGLKNCCKSKGGGGVTNSSWAQSLGMSVAAGAFKQGAGYAVSKGSGFVYDSLYSNAPQYLTPGVETFFDSAISNSWQSAGYGAFGIGTTADAAAGFFASSSSSVAIGNTGLYFNPYGLAAAVAIQLVMEALSCTQDEEDLAKARAENLCVEIGTYCSKHLRILGIVVACLEETTSFCCFNSLLAKAIQQGAHSQLGLSWGSPQSPNCTGLSPQQLTSIDFNSPQMQEAFAPFKEQIMKNVQGGVGAAIANGSVQSSITGKTSATAAALCEQRKKSDPTTVCN